MSELKGFKMKLENQVVSLELSKKLKGIGVEQKSYFYWYEIKKERWEIWDPIHLMQVWEDKSTCRDGKPLTSISAFTIAELGEMLPHLIFFDNYCYYLEINKIIDSWEILYVGINDSLHISKDINQANAYARMLIYLIENKLIKID